MVAQVAVMPSRRTEPDVEQQLAVYEENFQDQVALIYRNAEHAPSSVETRSYDDC